MDLGPHAAFIVAAYGAAVLLVGALIAWIKLDHWAQRRQLAALEAQGVARRAREAKS